MHHLALSVTQQVVFCSLMCEPRFSPQPTTIGVTFQFSVGELDQPRFGLIISMGCLPLVIAHQKFGHNGSFAKAQEEELNFVWVSQLC